MSKRYYRPALNISKEKILEAMRNSQSNFGAAKYLGVSNHTYKKYAKMYTNEQGIDLFTVHYNQSGKGTKKISKNYGPRSEKMIEDILSGKIDTISTDINKIKYILFKEGFLAEECNRCGFKECRGFDGKMPTILNFKDNDKKNWNLDNLEMLCYNCYFINIGNIFTEKQLIIFEKESIHGIKGEYENFQLSDKLKEIISSPKYIDDSKKLVKEKENMINQKILEEIEKEIHRDDDFGSDLISR